MTIISITDQDVSQKTSSGRTVEQTVDALIDEHSVLVFSKSSCPYCQAVKELLSRTLQVNLHVVEINQLSSGNATTTIVSHLQSKTGHGTVPQVFLDGQFLGTHDDLMALDAKGLLEGKLKKHMKGPRQSTTTSSSPKPLFWFPPTVNKWAIRSTGLLSSVVSGTTAYLMLQESTSESATTAVTPMVGMVAAALFGDFTLRLLAGSQVAPLAQVGGVLASLANLTPIPRPGAPKQFASLCGTMFSGLGAAFYWNGNPTVGGGFLAVLALCAGMEGGIDFCLGCKFFAIGESIYSMFSPKEAKKAV